MYKVLSLFQESDPEKKTSTQHGRTSDCDLGFMLDPRTMPYNVVCHDHLEALGECSPAPFHDGALIPQTLSPKTALNPKP